MLYKWCLDLQMSRMMLSVTNIGFCLFVCLFVVGFLFVCLFLFLGFFLGGGVVSLFGFFFFFFFFW